MFIGQSVITPYGYGKIEHFRYFENGGVHIILVRPSAWVLANDQKPVFYLNPRDVLPLYPIGCEVNTVFGKGVVVKIRSDDGIYVVHLENWLLATNTSPVLYLNESSISVCSKPEVNEGSSSTMKQMSEIDDRIRRAKQFKIEANAHFKKGEFESAKDKYIEVVSILRDTSPDSSVEDRAKTLEHMIPCNNNIALCCYKVKDYGDCIIFASSALQLITRLEQTKGKSTLIQALEAIGVTEQDLFQKMKRKSLYYLGKSKLCLSEYEESIQYLNEARALIPSNDEASIKESDDLVRKAEKYLEKERKKEKATWSKAFKKIEEEIEPMLDSTSNSPTSTPAVTPTKASSTPPSSATPTSTTPAKSNVTPVKKSVVIDNSRIDGLDLSALEKEDEDGQQENDEPEKQSSSSASMIANVVLMLSAVAIVGLVLFKAKGFRK